MPLQRYSFAEAVAYLQTSKRSLRRWVADGDIGFLRFGRKLCFTKEQLDGFLAQRGKIVPAGGIGALLVSKHSLEDLAARVERLESLYEAQKN